jgi:hypothetical protein
MLISRQSCLSRCNSSNGLCCYMPERSEGSVPTVHCDHLIQAKVDVTDLARAKHKVMKF